MSIMVLHDKTNNNWSSLGIGPLMDAISPKVTRERNGVYELTFSYPMLSPLFSKLAVGRWIVADAGPSANAKAQRFEIAEITKPKNGIVTVFCEHYRYQLLRSIVKLGAKYESISTQTALNALAKLIEPKGDFTFYSDVATKSTIDFTDPTKFQNAQEALGGAQGSILDGFGGEYIFDNNQVRLMAQAGSDRNVIIAYGKNLTDISQEESISNTYTSVYGFAKTEGETSTIITLPEVYIDSAYVGNYAQRRIQMVDFSQDKPENVTQLRTLVQNYIKNNKVGIPKVSITTKYEDLASSVMDESLKNLELIDLCDWVTVLFNDLNINASAQIIKTVWDVSLEKFDSLDLGEAATNMSKVISDSKTDTGNIVDRIGWLESAQKEASDILNNPGEGHVVIYPSLADPQEILIMDTTDVNTAQNVWKWNSGGLGFSSTGYKGTYSLAMTNNGAIVADRMTTGTLQAIDIVGVSISASDITGANIFGGLIKGAQFVQSDEGKSAVLGMRYGKLGFFTSESAALEGNNSFASVYGNSSSGGTIIIHAGNTYFRIYGSSLSNFGGPLEILGKITGDKGADLYGTLDMHGYSIQNQSDIRLKENITAPTISGITETKRIQMVEFDFRQYYDSQNPEKQRPSTRQFGLIAQSTPFLAEIADESENHYLSVDLNKQVNLNTLTNKELIEKVEALEKKLIIKQKGSRKAYSRKGKRCRIKH